MADASARDVAALRKQTGAGMMDCKAALEASGGDLEQARSWLRERNLAGVGKRAGRAADQGAVDVVVRGGVGAVVELTCETDFVAKGADFTAMVSALARQVAEHGDDVAGLALDGGTVADAMAQLSGRLGEKIELGRVARFETTDGLLDAYKHVQNGRGTIGVLVELGGVDPADRKAREVAHDVALQVASTAPRYVCRDDVPAELVEKERAVLEALTRHEGKPEPAISKIVDGRLNGFYKEQVLVEQPFVRDAKIPVGDLLEVLGPGATVRRFTRIKVGEE